MEEIGISYFQAEQWFDKCVIDSQVSQHYLGALWNKFVENYPQLLVIEEENGTMWMAIGDCHIIEVRANEIILHREPYVPIRREALKTAKFVRPRLLPLE